jgi:hypothetical protein
MKASALMAGLYPPAVRERWGTEISHQVAESGIRSWPDTVTQAVRLWLHPSDWPETLAGQTRRVLAVALFAVVGLTALLLRATTPSVDLRHPATGLWLAPFLAGIGLAVPLPRTAMLRRLTSVAVRTLAAPALALLALYVTARSGLVEHPSGPARAALIGYYWATLGFIALRLCTFVARVGRTATMPGTRRLCAALLLIGGGLALATVQWLLAGSFVVTAALGVLSAVTITTGYDLARRRSL